MWDACRRALDGMHPTLRQVPPREPLFSMQTVLSPYCAPFIAATYPNLIMIIYILPPGPPPITAKSYSFEEVEKSLMPSSLLTVDLGIDCFNKKRVFYTCIYIMIFNN